MIAAARRSSNAPRSTDSSASAPGERALELDDLLRAPAALDESGPDEEEDADRAHCKTGEEGEDDHRVDER